VIACVILNARRFEIRGRRASRDGTADMSRVGRGENVARPRRASRPTRRLRAGSSGSDAAAYSPCRLCRPRRTRTSWSPGCRAAGPAETSQLKSSIGIAAGFSVPALGRDARRGVRCIERCLDARRGGLVPLHRMFALWSKTDDGRPALPEIVSSGRAARALSLARARRITPAASTRVEEPRRPRALVPTARQRAKRILDIILA